VEPVKHMMIRRERSAHLHIRPERPIDGSDEEK
jgi:hypothetical protein